MAPIFLFVYAGIMGLIGLEAYLTKHSLPSLAGGMAAALLAVGAAFLCKQSPKAGIGFGIFVVLAFAGRFISTLAKGTGSFWPAGFIVLLSLVTLIGLVVAFAQSKRTL